MLAGRLPSQNAPQEVAVDQIGAQQLNLHVGSVLTMAALNNSPQPRLVPLTEHVVGIFVTRGSVLPVTYIDRDADGGPASPCTASSAPTTWPSTART